MSKVELESYSLSSLRNPKGSQRDKEVSSVVLGLVHTQPGRKPTDNQKPARDPTRFGFYEQYHKQKACETSFQHNVQHQPGGLRRLGHL